MPSTRLIYFILFFLPQTHFGQILSDEQVRHDIHWGMDKLYNLEFAAAEQAFKKVRAAYPQHPVGHLLQALQIQWQHMPLEKDPKALTAYIKALNRCKAAAQTLTHTEEAAFFMMASYGYIALSYNYQKEYTKAVQEARLAYSYLKQGMKLTQIYPDFLFTSGLYNYYRIQYPETHTLVKPIMVFFEGGDREKGLLQLESATQKATFTKIEATAYLGNIYIKYHNDRSKALQLWENLGKKYPNNLFFKMRYTEALLLNGKFGEAERHIEFLEDHSSPIFKLAGQTFKGILVEFGQKNKLAAKQHYLAATRLPSDSRYNQEYKAMAFVGLARYYYQEKDMDKARAALKQAQSLAEYTWLRAEIRELGKRI